MNELNFLTNVEDLDAVLSKFEGGTGAVVTFLGHRTLTVEFQKDERVFTARFVDCLYMATPMTWDKVKLSCSHIGERIQVEDREAEVKIVCSWIHCAEDEDEDEDEDS